MNSVFMPATALTTLKKAALALLCCTLLMAVAASAQNPGPNPKIGLTQSHARAFAAAEEVNTCSGNCPPPSGAILDLNGTPIPGGGNGSYQQYTATFTASLASTAITLAFRDDPAFLSIAEVSLTDLSHPAGNLLTNGDFSGGTYSDNGNDSTPIGWTFTNQYGASFYGVVSDSSCATPLPSPATFCWWDGSVQAYDAISQTVTTTVGDIYQVSFWVAENSGCATDGGGPTCNFSDLSTNGDTTNTGGNGINVTVYAQNGLPPATQPLNVTLLDSGTGTVTDNLEAIDCTESNGTVSGTCSANYPFNQPVTLTAQVNVPSASNPPSTFTGWGGDCASFGTNTQCTLTMNGAMNVTATFDIPGQTDTGTVPTAAGSPPTTYPYNGGYAPDNGGYDFTATGSNPNPDAPTFNAVTTAISTDLATCDALIAPSFPNAKCFVFQLGASPQEPTDTPVMYELTCPSSSGDTCGSLTNPNFLATLGADFSFDVGENPPLNLVNSNPNIVPYGPLQASGGNPYVAFLKGEGPDSAHPCTPFPPDDPRNQTMFSNQTVSFTLVDTGSKPITAGSSGTGSCWIPVYLVQDETPTVAITSPVNNAQFTQGEQDASTVATYACTTVYNGVSTATGGTYAPYTATGPYLTGTCSAIDSPGGSVSQGGYVDTNTIGSHTLTATVLDSATNTASASVTYTVQGTQAILLSGVPASAVYGSMFTVGATGGASGNPIMFSSAGGCTNLGATYTMMSGTTPCSVIANQSGNSNYQAAQQVSQSVNATPAAQNIMLTGVPTSAAYGSMFTVGATGGGSGNPVMLTSAGACSNSGATYTMNNSTGNCSVIANQAGNGNYSAAPTVTKTVTATANISNVSLTLGPNTNKLDFTLINLCPSTLAAGKTCYISVLFFSGNLGSVSATLKLTDNAPGSPQQVTSMANVIGFSPSSLSFGTFKVGKSSTMSVTLNNTGTTAVNVTGVNITGANAHDFVKSSSTCSGSLAAGHGCSVSVTFTPSAKGSRSATLTLTDNVPLGALIVPLSGTGN